MKIRSYHGVTGDMKETVRPGACETGNLTRPEIGENGESRTSGRSRGAAREEPRTSGRSGERAAAEAKRQRGCLQPRVMELP